ncbi:MAG: SIMPL domain-containing protein [Kordiimonadaceae bacterium]|jgi:uncharacterized protein|nr:SIMPL domain-containing protein [Kordiimonadaceae bacterium]MBT6032843.1 SIMPL domain-containing protein [Kordiimonadaceae bacterium]
MRKIQFLTLLIVSMFTVTACNAQETSICQGALITMNATGEIESIPDVAEVLLNVKSQANNEVSALQDLSKNIQKIITVLEDLKIKDEDIRTDSISIRPVFNQRDRQEIIAYAGASRVYFKTYDLEKITDLMNGVMAGSDNLFSNITYSSTDKESLEDQARTKAFQKAQHKAKLYADLSGNKLGSVCTITENNVQMMPRRMDLARQETMSLNSAPANISIPIKPGKITTTAQVTLVYQLEN